MKRRWAPSCRQAGSRQVAQLPHPRRSRSASTHLQQRAHGGHVGAPGAGQVLVRLAVAAVRVWVRQQRRQRGPLVLLLSQAAVGGGRQRRWRAWQRRRVGHWAEHDPHRFGVDQRRSAGAKAAAGAAQAAEARQQLGDAVQASFHVHSRGRPACVMLQGRCGCGKEVCGGSGGGGGSACRCSRGPHREAAVRDSSCGVSSGMGRPMSRVCRAARAVGREGRALALLLLGRGRVPDEAEEFEFCEAQARLAPELCAHAARPDGRSQVSR